MASIPRTQDPPRIGGRRRHASLLLCGVLLIGLFGTPYGRALFTRTYLRAETVWANHMPVRVRSWPRDLHPVLRSVGLMRPLRLELEPHVVLMLDPDDLLSRTILASLHTHWEPQIWEAIAGGLEEGAVFLDVGAHIGYYSLKAGSAVGPSGRVIAFEPNPNTLEMLRSNIAASAATNIDVQPIACSDSEGTLTFYDSTARGNSGASSLSHANAGAAAVEYQVRGRRIDDVMRESGIARVDVIKIDVEGAELVVLRGAEDTIRRHHPKIILEVVPGLLANLNASPDDLAQFLRRLGYANAVRLDDTNMAWQ